jgi:hypothetical protein
VNPIKNENILKKEWIKSVHDLLKMDKKCPYPKIFEDFFGNFGKVWAVLL